MDVLLDVSYMHGDERKPVSYFTHLRTDEHKVVGSIKVGNQYYPIVEDDQTAALSHLPYPSPSPSDSE